jgi:Cys-tRNA(Pro)/Cys-tRNA(Cys) deacylase
VAKKVKDICIHNQISFHELDNAMHTADEAAQVLGISASEIAKSIVLKSKCEQIIIVVLRGDSKFDKKKIEHSCDVKGLKFVPAHDIEATVGHIAGGVSPLGLPVGTIILVDNLVLNLSKVFVGGGRPETLVEISPTQLVSITEARIGNYSI